MILPNTIKELQDELFEKKYKAVDLVDGYLARIKTLDKDLNSFITVTEGEAYSQAKSVDGLLSEGRSVLEKKPLLGAVFAVKDMYCTKGIRTTAGSRVLDSYIPPYSATAIKKLENAGAILIGKTNQDAWAHGASGENSDFGPTKNPWDRSRVPGGSSSGSAAALGANFCTAALGTDTGGSVRQPAGFTNLVGLRPTYGSVSRYGVIAMASSLDTVAFFGQTVKDVEKIFDVLKGPDGYDATVSGGRVQSASRRTKLKIGLPKEYFEEGLNSEVRVIIEKAVSVFRRIGHEVLTISLPMTRYAVSTYYIIQPAEVSSNLARYDGVRFGAGRSRFGDEAKRRIMLGSFVLSAGYHDKYYGKATQVRAKIAQDLENAFDKVDLILTPTSPTPAFELGEKEADPLSMYLADVYTAAASLAGVPAMSLPVGFTKTGLPVGMQIISSKFNEEALFAAGVKYQQVTDWHKKHPTI